MIAPQRGVAALMTAGCARCGSCCDPVILEADIFLGCGQRARPQETASRNDRFIAEHWHPLSAWTDDDGTSVLALRCDMFDPESRACTAYESRPPVCSRFPWYGDTPSAGRAAGLLPHCSYLADLPPDQRKPDSRPLIPVTVL
jgi:Putative zinc- or iron-chelating domain